MALNYVELPFDYFPNFEKGRPLFGGKIYVGEVGTDPSVEANQKQIYIQEAYVSGTTPIPVSQPITVSSGGVPQYNGSPVIVTVDGDYSILVLDKNDSQEYYYPSVRNGVPISVETISNYTTINFDTVANAQLGILPNGDSVTLKAGDVIRIEERGASLFDLLTTSEKESIENYQGHEGVTCFQLSGQSVWICYVFKYDNEVEALGVDNEDASTLENLYGIKARFVFDSNKSYKIDNYDLDISTQSWHSNGATLDGSEIEDTEGNYAIRFYNGGNRLFNSISYLTNGNAFEGFTVVGQSRDSNIKAMYFYSPEYPMGSVNIGGHVISEFGVGHEYYTNSYIITHYGANVLRCGKHVYMPDGGGNYGENIKYVGGTISTSQGTALHNANPNGTITCVGTSLDYTGKIAYAERGLIDLSQCHIEFDNGVNDLTDIPFETGDAQDSVINVTGGRVLGFTSFTQDYLCKTSDDSNALGSGIFFDGVMMQKVITLTGKLKVGTQPFHIRNTKLLNGNGNTGVSNIVGDTENLMSDGGFDLDTLPDIFISENPQAITDRLSANNITITRNTSDYVSGTGSMQVAKTFGVGSQCQASALVSIDKFQQIGWSLMAKALSGTGTATIQAWFVCFLGADEYGLPIINREKVVSGSPRTIDAATHTDWTEFVAQRSRVNTPSWATHVRLDVDLFNGNALNIVIDDLIITQF